MAKIIMIQGTASNVGKSILTAALCRIFSQDGYKVAPFKSQNMALNSFITQDGLEMGRAQVMQAEACGIKPDVRMNPILLKPTSDCGSQVIILGKAVGNKTAKEYWSNKTALKPIIKQAFDSLASENDIIIIEGAGSPAEINLKDNDIVNMGMAKMVNAPVLLVGDIDRGGVFASLYGTVKLLQPDEQDKICGLIINKFRGDIDILRSGLKMLEGITDKKVIGVVPYAKLDLDDEDSLSEKLETNYTNQKIKVAVIKFPHISNFTDFDVFSRIDGVGLYYATRPEQLNDADLIILSGTKNTIKDLKWLKESGLESSILKCYSNDILVFGICGGYQMMGSIIADPENTEGGGEINGMNIFNMKTVFSSDKITAQVKGQIHNIDCSFSALSGINTSGYEIHMGKSILDDNEKPFQTLYRGNTKIMDGCYKQNAYGTYMHGIFDNIDVVNAILSGIAKKKGVCLNAEITSLEEYKQKEYDKLADIVRKSLDMNEIYRILEEGITCKD